MNYQRVTSEFPTFTNIERRSSKEELREKNSGTQNSLSRNDEQERYDVDLMNSEFALVLIGNQAEIVRNMPDGQLRFLRVDAFKTFYANRFTEVRGYDGRAKSLTWAQRWLADSQRRQYAGIEFFPDRDNAPGQSDHLNLWRGFSYKPKPGGSYHIFRDHLQTNVCSGNLANFSWMFGWFAHLIQKPREKPGTAIVLRGVMGCGKSTVGEVFGSLIGAHHFQVDDPKFVTGNFNKHMLGCLLLQADEATWAGDRAAEGRLKGLITSSSQMIEAKGIDAIKQNNYVRLLKTTNSDWSVPAGKNERRFAVFDVDPRCAQNFEYFAEMHAELNEGGREALLHDLLEFDLTGINLREIPKTRALLEQKTLSLEPMDEWWLDRLHEGKPTRAHSGWPDFIETDALYDDFVDATIRTGVRRRSGQTVFGIKLRKLVPNIRKRKISVDVEGSTVRRLVYYLPPLDTCRDLFAAEFNQQINWSGLDELSAPLESD